MIRPIHGGYATNIMHFIRYVRQDLKAPNLPFVIGQMGSMAQRRRFD